MKIGTKSVLFGAHCFFLHPWFLVYAWYKLYGFAKVKDPHVGWVSLKDPRLWMAFFVHDLGYLGKPNMDGEEGELHPRMGAKIMSRLFDGECKVKFFGTNKIGYRLSNNRIYEFGPWGNFVLYHSRFLSKRHGTRYSILCVADKLAVSFEPWWLYIPRAILSGEIKEYMADGEAGARGEGKYAGEQHTKQYENRRDWFFEMSKVMRNWAYDHKDGREDQVTLQSHGS